MLHLLLEAITGLYSNNVIIISPTSEAMIPRTHQYWEYIRSIILYHIYSIFNDIMIQPIYSLLIMGGLSLGSKNIVPCIGEV